MRVEQAKYMLQKIIKIEKGVVSGRDVLRACRRYRTMDELDPGFKLLEEYGYIRRLEQNPAQGKGRPNTLYEVNPDVTA